MTSGFFQTGSTAVRMIGCLAVLMLCGMASGQAAEDSPAGSSAMWDTMFTYAPYLVGSPSTLSVWVVSSDSATGFAQLSGNDSQAPTTPFTWKWGDGATTSGFFPHSHTYSDRSHDYTVTVIANYNGGAKDTAYVTVKFRTRVPITFIAEGIGIDEHVYVPSVKPTLGTRLYTINPSLTVFDDSYFTVTPRVTVESILGLASTIEMDFTNSDVYKFMGSFEQYLLRDPAAGGAYSIWYSDPVAFGAANTFLQGDIGYSSLIHEMGHNFTLNTPASYYYGGRIDGNANAIFSEAMAQIYQHAAGYVLVNSAVLYDLPEELRTKIRESLISSIGVTHTGFTNYVTGGKPFASWNNPSTPSDETFGTFMTVAHKFMDHAESAGNGYRSPLKRMMHLLQQWDASLAAKYDRTHNTAAADSFRATLMVSAVSYAFDDDFRQEFRDLNFPVSDSTYNLLHNLSGQINTVPAVKKLFSPINLLACETPFAIGLDTTMVFIDPDGDPLTYSASSTNTAIAEISLSGASLTVTGKGAGTARVKITAADNNGGADTTAFYVVVTGTCCCIGQTGNVDCDPGGGVDISDLAALIDYLYITFTPLCCAKQANVDGDAGAGVDISDLAALIDYLYISFTVPANCQ